MNFCEQKNDVKWKEFFSQDPQTKFDDMRELPNSTKLLSLQVFFFKVSIECQTFTVTFALRKKTMIHAIANHDKKSSFDDILLKNSFLLNLFRTFFPRKNSFHKFMCFAQMIIWEKNTAYCDITCNPKQLRIRRFKHFFTNFRWFKWTIVRKRALLTLVCRKKRMTQSTSNFKNLHTWYNVFWLFSRKNSLHKYKYFAYMIFWEKKKTQPSAI